MNSFLDVCDKLSEISHTLEPEHFFFFITLWGLCFCAELMFSIINLIVQISFKIRAERKKIKSDIK